MELVNPFPAESPEPEGKGLRNPLPEPAARSVAENLPGRVEIVFQQAALRFNEPLEFTAGIFFPGDVRKNNHPPDGNFQAAFVFRLI